MFVRIPKYSTSIQLIKRLCRSVQFSCVFSSEFCEEAIALALERVSGLFSSLINYAFRIVFVETCADSFLGRPCPCLALKCFNYFDLNLRWGRVEVILLPWLGTSELGSRLLFSINVFNDLNVLNVLNALN